jgi:hypothetical protein
MNMHIHILCQNILSLLMVYGTTRLMKYFTRINVFIVNKYIIKSNIVKVDASTQTDGEPLLEPFTKPLLEPVIEPLKNDYEDWVDMASAIAYSAD